MKRKHIVCWGTRSHQEPKNKFFTPEDHASIIRMRKEGYTFAEIAIRLPGDHSPQGVRLLYKRLCKAT